MATLPILTESAIRAITDSGSFSRGRDYFQSGQIINPRRQGLKLQAQAMGSELYRTEVTFDEHGISRTNCSCPVASNCKHVVALLLTYLHTPTSFKEVSETRTVLEERTQTQLIELILKMIALHPDLETLVDLPIVVEASTKTKVDPQTLLRQLRGGQHRRGRYDYDDYGNNYEQAEPVIDIADQFVEVADWGNAILTYTTVADELTQNYEEYSDHEGGLGDALSRCIDGLVACLDKTKDSKERIAALHALCDIYLWDVEQGGIGEGDGVDDAIVAAASAEEKASVVQWINAALPGFSRGVTDWRRQALGQFLLALQMDTLDDEGFLEISRQTGRYRELIDRLLTLGRIQEANEEAAELAAHDLLMVDDVFQSHQQAQRYEGLVYDSWQKSKDYRLANWLKQSAARQKDNEKTLQFAQILFNERPSLELYREIKQLAKSENWQTLRTKLSEQVSVQRGMNDLTVRIWLEDGEFEKAIQTVSSARKVGDFYYSDHLKSDVATAVEPTQPQAAIAILSQLAQAQIGARNRPSYAVAATYLSRIKRIYERISDVNSWQQLISGIRSQYKNLPALHDELRKSRL